MTTKATRVRLTQPLKFYGGKHYLAERIIAQMPRHLHYVEPFAGGLAVLLARDPNDHRLWKGFAPGEAGVSEVVNDIDGDLMNFWRVLRDEKLFPHLVKMCEATPVSRGVYDEAASWAKVAQFNTNPVYRAWVFFTHCRLSRAGSFKGFTTLTRNRTRRGINSTASEWLGAIDGLPAVHARLRAVVMECMEADDLIRREDGPDTLFYCDPPYLHSSRAAPDSYTWEMSEEQHTSLLDLLVSLRGKVMLSGYPSALYSYKLDGRPNWRRLDIDIANHVSGKKSKRRMTECLWMNWRA